MISLLSAHPDNLAFCNKDGRGQKYVPVLTNSTADKFQVEFSCEGDEDQAECQENIVPEMVAWL